jgi:YggT family protein
MQLFRADFYSPLSQFIVKITDPVLKPIRRIVPGLGGIDISSLLFAFVVAMIKIAIVYSIPSLSGLILLTIRELLISTIYLYIGMILIRIVISWVSPGLQNPIMSVINQLSEPVMAPVRRIIPPIGGLDLSTLILLLGLQFSIKGLDIWIFSPLLRIVG